ncbi:hypothetical protein [Microvirga yunnanensis]|uniref:hypothetical protein n=1 Tax=Microvirga yunnanensis TaxID=2953740 RepID=UPI0021CA8981|nr:hypothetical protein [Microvirga sp. HBU65207]
MHGKLVQAHGPPAELLSQLGLPDNLVIGLIVASDLVLGLPVAGGQQGNNLITTEPDPGGRSILGVADVLTGSVAMRSHDRILSCTWVKPAILLIFHQDQSRTTIGTEVSA